MFKNDKKSKGKAEVTRTASRNIIDSQTQIKGDIISKGDFRIDGELEGTLKTEGKVIIGKNAVITGKIECSYADVEGKFSGEFIVSNTLTAKSTANIKGDLIVGQISTELGAVFNISCNMKGAVKDLNSNGEQTQTA